MDNYINKMEDRVQTVTSNQNSKALYGIWFANLILIPLTLGIYRCWGETKLRRCVIGALALKKDVFKYTGTGNELFIGILCLIPFLAFFIPISIILVFALAKLSPSFKVESFIALLLVLPLRAYLYPSSIYTSPIQYGAWRYQLSRISWKGSSIELSGSAWWYAVLVSSRLLLKVASLWLLAPYMDVKIRRYVYESAAFGNTKFTCKAKARKIVLNNLVTLFLALPTFGLSRFWYAAALKRELYANLKLNSIGFRCHYTGRGLMNLHVGNYFIALFTLGLAYPTIIRRNLDYLTQNVEIVGNLDNEVFVKNPNKVSRISAGLDGLMNYNASLFG